MRNKLISYTSKIYNLEQKNNALIKKLSTEKEKNADLKNIIDKLLVNNNQINNIIKSVNQFENLSKDLKDKFGKINPLDQAFNNEKMIVINFVSVDQKINCPIICKTTSKFINVMQDFLERYPEYSENDCEDLTFLGNGNKMVKMNSMEKNGFSGYSILVQKNSI